MALLKALTTDWGIDLPAGYMRIRELHWRRPEHERDGALLIEVVVDVYVDASAYAKGGQPIQWLTYTVPLAQDLRPAMYALLKSVPALSDATDA